MIYFILLGTNFEGQR